jgi:hypothetical protein
VIATALLWSSTSAAQPEVEACATASEDAQRLVTAHQLVAARERLLACTRPQCPKAIVQDCDTLLSQVDAALPTIVIVVRDARDHDVTDATVTIDGRPVGDALAGTPVPVDPGRHVVRAARATGAPVEVVVVVPETVKNRVVTARFAPETPVAPPRHRGRTVGSFVLGGLGIGLFGTFAYLAITGQRDVDRCESTGCIRSETDAIARKRIYAWVSAGAGVVAASSAIYLYVTSTPDGKPALAIAGNW